MKNTSKLNASRVINKESLESKLSNYYSILADLNNITEEEARESIVRVSRLRVYIADYGMSVGGAYCDDFDEDYAFDYECRCALEINSSLVSAYHPIPSTQHTTIWD